MGFLSFLLAALAMCALVRSFDRSRTLAFDLTLAISASVIAGAFATALDFGGWNAFDLRSLAFAALTGLTALLGSRLGHPPR
jgi:hypothetical protein